MDLLKLLPILVKIKMINTEELQKLLNNTQYKLLNSISSNNSYNNEEYTENIEIIFDSLQNSLKIIKSLQPNDNSNPSSYEIENRGMTLAEIRENTQLIVNNSETQQSICNICRENLNNGENCILRKINSCGHIFHKILLFESEVSYHWPVHFGPTI